MILVEEWTMGPDWNLHPNPSAQNSNLSCTLVSDHEARITLVDASGRIVDTIYEGKLQAGPHNFQLSPADKSKGTYFVVIELDGNPNALPWVIK